MPRLLAIEVSPADGQVAMLDATWQDYPVWDSDDEWVAFRAPSLADPDRPPYPGFAVAAGGRIRRRGARTVVVEVWGREAPAGGHEVFRSVLSVGRHGVEVGNEDSGALTRLAIPEGQHDLQVWVDGHQPDQVTWIGFVLPELTMTSRLVRW
ncbi:hypothetical protein AB0K15_34880 [Amycolatopsis sp. NPDC049253]|uniref:hypothetical protein n=1 Tax=Amycolatopsis sp. NPDC049253 TaxID=3155274 RepID=UPI00343C7E82